MASTLVASMDALTIGASSNHGASQTRNHTTKRHQTEGSKRGTSNRESTGVKIPTTSSSSTIEAITSADSARRRQNPPRNSRPTTKVPVKPWKMLPDLHDNVQDLLSENNLNFTFRTIDNESNMLGFRNTNIMGRFECTNKRCSSKGWPSKVIPITIRYYAGRQYNARVYKQRCKRCNHLGKFQPDDSYVERVVYWLKTWSGVPMQRLVHSGAPTTRPHEESLCEGCKAGVCRQD